MITMIIETYYRENIKIIKIKGQVSLDNHDELYKSLINCVKGEKRVVLDLEQLSYLNSMGLGTIIKIYSKLKKNNCKLVLCCLNDNIKELFAITKLDKVLDIYDSLEKAILYYQDH